MQENAEAFKALSPLTSREQDQLHEVVRLFKDAGPIGADLSRFQGLTLHGAPVTGIMEAYNICQLQPDSAFTDDNNYLKNVIAAKAHLD